MQFCPFVKLSKYCSQNINFAVHGMKIQLQQPRGMNEVFCSTLLKAPQVERCNSLLESNMTKPNMKSNVNASQNLFLSEICRFLSPRRKNKQTNKQTIMLRLAMYKLLLFYIQQMVAIWGNGRLCVQLHHSSTHLAAVASSHFPPHFNCFIQRMDDI